MSDASVRGKSFELKVAKILRAKLGAKVSRDRQSGAGINKSDINDYYREIPLHLEIKDQETLKVKEWFRQAEGCASVGQAPTVVFAMDEEVLVVLRFSDLVNFVREIADQKAEINDLRQPIVQIQSTPKGQNPFQKLVEPVVTKKIKGGEKTCRAGHIADQWGYCMQLDCKFARGYRAPKKSKD